MTRTKPADGMRVVVTRVPSGETVSDIRLGAKGTTEDPVAGLAPGGYEAAFHVATWYRDQGVTLTDPPFLDVARFHFGISEADGLYHLPLKFTPWGYSLFCGTRLDDQ